MQEWCLFSSLSVKQKADSKNPVATSIRRPFLFLLSPPWQSADRTLFCFIAKAPGSTMTSTPPSSSYSTGFPPEEGFLSADMSKHPEGEKIATTPMQNVSLLGRGRYGWGCCCAAFGPSVSTSLEKQLQMQSD